MSLQSDVPFIAAVSFRGRAGVRARTARHLDSKSIGKTDNPHIHNIASQCAVRCDVSFSGLRLQASILHEERASAARERISASAAADLGLIVQR